MLYTISPKQTMVTTYILLFAKFVHALHDIDNFMR